MGFKKATRQVLESLNRGLDVVQQRYIAVHDELCRVKGVASSEVMRLEGRIDAQARTIADLEKQIAGMRGRLDAHLARLDDHKEYINKLSHAVFPAIRFGMAGGTIGKPKTVRRWVSYNPHLDYTEKDGFLILDIEAFKRQVLKRGRRGMWVDFPVEGL